VASVPRIESPGQRLESLGTPHLKLSDAEEENLEEAARRKPWMWSHQTCHQTFLAIVIIIIISAT